MRIRMLVQMPPGGLRNGQAWPDKGKTEDIPTGEARHLVASGIAESAEPAPRRRTKSKREDAS